MPERTLAELSIGDKANVSQVVGNDALSLRLLEMGLTPATEVEVVRAAPLRDPIELALRGYRLSIRKEEAQRILLADAKSSGAREESAWFVPAELQQLQARRVFLIGNPNSGKTTLFNRLTGAFEKTGNYAGVTVEARRAALEGAPMVEMWDFPGTYSLHAQSTDERHTIEALQAARLAHDALVCVVLDATALARGLYLAERVLRLGLPTLFVLTMIDEAKEQGIQVHVDALARAYGVPVFSIQGRSGVGVAELRTHLLSQKPGAARVHTVSEPPTAIADEVRRIFAFIDANIARFETRPKTTASSSTARLDRVLLHPVLGLAVFASVMFALFSALFSWVTPLSDLLEGAVAWSGEKVAARLGQGLLTDLLVHGVLQGVGNVITFVPQIGLLSLAIVLLEDSGYLARVAFVIDRVMRAAGLHGKAFVPMLSGFACAVPAIMATRTLERRRDRLITMLALPLMSCSARLPVYLLVVSSLFVGTTGTLVLLGMYVLSATTTVLAAALLRRFVLPGPPPPFVLELPPYRLPLLRNALRETYNRLLGFLKDAGTTILALTIVLWALLNFPQPPSPHATARERAEYSWAGRGGKALEPAIAPLGFDWRIGVGLIGSFAAREVFVSTMGLIFGLDDEVGEATEDATPALRDRVRAATWPDGRTLLDIPTGLALMVFFVMAAQCMSTLAVLRRESGSWKWPVFALVYMNTLAWVAAWITQHVARLLV